MSNTPTEAVEDRLLQVSERLRIPTNTLQITQVRMGQLRNKPDIGAENLDEFVAAALVLSAREDGLPLDEDTVEQAWSDALAGEDHVVRLSEQLLETTSVYLDIEAVPAHPEVLIEELGEAVEMPEALVAVARRLLRDVFETDPTVITDGRSPAATAAGALSLAARVNGHDMDDVRSVLGGASQTSKVAVENRSDALRGLLGDRVNEDRYQMGAEADGAGDAASRATAADGAGRDEASTNSAEPAPEGSKPGPADEGTGADRDAPTPGDDGRAAADTDATAAGVGADTDVGSGETELAVEAVEEEIDELVEVIEIDAPTRLLARGMAGDAVGEVEAESAGVLAGAMLVAGLRINDADGDVTAVADRREFEPRAITQSLDALDGAVDVDIPRRDPGDIVDDLVAELGLSEAVHEESTRALERYAVESDETDYTAAELAGGAVVFAATVNGTQVDVGEIAAIGGGEAEYVTDAMNAIVVSLCGSLVRGDIAYEECSWTTALLESNLSSALGDSQTGRAIALARSYIAGRRGSHVDDATVDVLLGVE